MTRSRDLLDEIERNAAQYMDEYLPAVDPEIAKLAPAELEDEIEDLKEFIDEENRPALAVFLGVDASTPNIIELSESLLKEMRIQLYALREAR